MISRLEVAMVIDCSTQEAVEKIIAILSSGILHHASIESSSIEIIRGDYSLIELLAKKTSKESK